MKRRGIISIVLCAILTLGLVSTGLSMPPTKEAIEKWIAEGVYDQKVSNWNAFKDAGGCEPWEYSPLKTLRGRRGAALGTDVLDTLHLIVIMVEFTDWLAVDQNASGTPADFDSILFSDRTVDPVLNPTGSMTDFYLENSYGQFEMDGGVTKWYSASQNLSYYAAGASGFGAYPRTSSRLVEEALTLADPDVDFSEFDSDGWRRGLWIG